MGTGGGVTLLLGGQGIGVPQGMRTAGLSEGCGAPGGAGGGWGRGAGRWGHPLGLMLLGVRMGRGAWR